MTSHSKQRLVISYVLLVGIPLLGVVGVLGAGRGLTAPISVAGNWDLQLGQSCGAGLGFTEPTILDISQSGNYLTLTLNSQPQVGLQGTLQGKTVAASLGSPPETSYSGAAGLSLTAEVDTNAAPRTMSVVLSFDGSPSCGSVFHAVRQAFPPRRRSE
jgi:hypothetical protein